MPTPTQPAPTPDDNPASPAASPHLASRISLFDRIVLTGFMGSGKTTAGRLLARTLHWAFLDLDREIEAREGRSVPQIFAESGEAHFRRLEARTLAALLGRRNVVIALGGGAPEELGNRLLLEQTPRTAVIHLAAPLELLLERCRVQSLRPDATARPVLADLETATRRYIHRLPLYNRLATHTIHTATHNPTTTVQAILTALST